jgi:CRP-like cAMP-binding protein
MVHGSKRPRLSATALAALAAYGAKAHWPEGFAVYERGTTADGLFVVLSGCVILRTTKGKRRFVPAIAFAGETFGGEGVTPGAEYATDAVAFQPSETLHIDGGRFRALLREQPAQALSLIAQAFAERTTLLEQIHHFSASSVDERVVSALLRLFEGRANGSGKMVLRPGDHRLLCEMVGATRESITHALSRLTATGIAQREGADLVLSRRQLLDERRSRQLPADRAIARQIAVETGTA